MNAAVLTESTSQLSFAIETVTPAVARAWLELNRSNRPLARNTVAHYAAAIRAGEWLVNGEAIKFDREGRLVDGQHRLAAVVKADIAVDFLVIRGLEAEVFKTLDTGRNRSLSDVLAIGGVKNPIAVGVACRLLYRTLADEIGLKRRITNTQLEQMRTAHTRLLPLFDEADHSPFHTGLLPSGQRMFAFYMAVQVHEQKARTFFGSLAGAKAGTGAAHFAALRLRERLETTADEIVKPSTTVRLAWTIQAWNAAYAGRPVDRFSRLITTLPAWDPMPRFAAVKVSRETR